MTMARFTVLIAILLALPSVARAQLGWLPPQKGLPLETTQPTHAEGRITVTTDVGQQFLLREIDYMVAPWPQSRYTARYRTVNAVRWEGGFTTRQAAGIELLEGAAYFHIEPPVMPLGPGDVVQIVNLQPDQYVPVLLGALVDNNIVASDLVGRVNPELTQLIMRGAQAPYGVIPTVAGDRQITNRVRTLVAALDPNAKPIERLDKQRTAVELVHQAAELKYVQAYIASIAFPFMMTRRLVGGAEGTEGVVYIHPDANDANACDVYVAYLHSNKSHPMRLQGYSYIDPLIQTHTSLLSFDEGEYVRARLVRKPYLWSQEWFVASFDPPKPIDGNAPAQLLETIRRAHQQACDLDGIQPASVSLPGLELNCN